MHGLPTPLNFGAFGLGSPGVTPGGLVSPGLHKMMEIDPDNWFADPEPGNAFTLQEFFKDDHSIFNEPEEPGVFA
jgi:hypothetical protein